MTTKESIGRDSKIDFLLRLSPLILFSLAIVVILINRLIINEIIFDEVLISTVLPADMSPSEIAQIMKLKNDYSWVSYVITPINFIFVELLMAVTLYAGFSFFKKNVPFKKILNAFLIAGIVAAVIGVLHLLIQTQLGAKVSSIEDLRNLDQLSLHKLFQDNTFDDWCNYLLREINIKLILYLLIVPYFLEKVTDYKKDYVLNMFVCISGGLWLVYTTSVIGVLASI